jgi:hypothetical protein
MNKQLGEQVKLEQTKKIKAEMEMEQAFADRATYVDLAEFNEQKLIKTQQRFEKSSVSMLKQSTRLAMLVSFIRSFAASYIDEVSKLKEIREK